MALERSGRLRPRHGRRGGRQHGNEEDLRRNGCVGQPGHAVNTTQQPAGPMTDPWPSVINPEELVTNGLNRRGQNWNLTANWICRADPESPVGKRVLAITPNEVLPTVAIRPGCPKFDWLNRLNTSTRNCARERPARSRFLMNDRSVLPNPGP